jgi:hydrogenase maturation protease
MKTLVAGFGNVLLGDDGFGVEVIRRLQSRTLPDGTELLDAGIGGFNFVMQLMDGYDRVIIVDAMQRGETAGTLSVFHPPPHDRHGPVRDVNPHITEPVRAMHLASQLSVLPAHVTVVSCEVAGCDVRIGLSDPVSAAVDEAILAVEQVLCDWKSSTL